MPNVNPIQNNLLCPICGQSHCDCELRLPDQWTRPVQSRPVFRRSLNVDPIPQGALPYSSHSFTPGEAVSSVPFQYGARANLTVNGRNVGSVESVDFSSFYWTPRAEQVQLLSDSLSDPQAAVVIRNTMTRGFNDVIYTRAVLNAFLKHNGFKKWTVWESNVEPTIFLKICHFWFRLSRFEADLKGRIPVSVKYVCTKMTLKEWIVRSFKRLIVGYKFAHRRPHVRYTKFDFVLGSKK